MRLQSLGAPLAGHMKTSNSTDIPKKYSLLHSMHRSQDWAKAFYVSMAKEVTVVSESPYAVSLRIREV